MIGRKREQEILWDLYDRGNLQLVAIYGRRRVGKTYLVNETFRGKISFSHSGISPLEIEQGDKQDDKSLLPTQLEAFYRSLVKEGFQGNKPKDWWEAFDDLEKVLDQKTEKRLLVFLDEIQWMDTPKSSFLAAFDSFYNLYGNKKGNLMVILCGSSTSWMMNKIVNNHGGLYDRVTRQIPLAPFSLEECKEYALSLGIDWSDYDLACCYMALGGIPYYWNYLSSKLSLSQNLDEMFFSKQAPLAGEFSRLFSSLFSQPEEMEQLVRTLAKKRRGLTQEEICKALHWNKGGTLTNRLKALEAGDFILRYVSFGEAKREPLYKLIDPFCLFYLTFVDTRTTVGDGAWLKISSSPKGYAWRGLAFENVCFHHIQQIKSALGISGVSTSASLWAKKGNDEDRGSQIDLLLERADNVCDACEIKFVEGEFEVDKDYHLVLADRKNALRSVLPSKRSLQFVLICTYGLKKNPYSSDFPYVITLEDLFRA
jgi:predicted AAA+ superfamily ATPase